jgi:NAD(P)-dependent dehydrogenase (short-subunit alcohol dehydrogenase family)
MTEIAGKIAVVTGGASGIGRGIAEQLIAEGAQVVIADIDGDAVTRVAAEIGAIGIQTDVTSSASVQSLADATVAHFGRVDIIVNNAGVGPVARMEDLSLEDWKWIMDVNMFGVIHGVHSFLPLLIANKEGGHIVNTASMAIFAPMAGLGAYTASKFAVQGLSESLALEMKSDHPNIHVTIVPPGPVRTNISQSMKHRPQDQKGNLTDVQLQDDPVAAQLRWVEPDVAGRIVTRAIKNNDLYALTHPEWWPMVADRVAVIQSEFDKYPPLEAEQK